MHVRRATVEDASAAAAVMAAVALEGSIGAEPPVDVVRRTAQLCELIDADPPAAVWVLDDGGAVAGYAVASVRPGGVLSLAMAVVAGARRQGGGRALVQAATDHGRAAGAHKLDLEVWVDNAPAIALYASSGFTVEGLRRDHYRRADGSLRSTLIMARRLAGGD